ncbi:hypothetical protein ACQ4PT_003590 [Festuca glaucescens]
MPPAAAFSSFSALVRRPPPPRFQRLLVAAARAHSTSGASQARGGLPRFHSPYLPSSKASALILSRYSSRSLVELFDGAGGLVEGSIQKVDKNGSDVELLENARVIAPQGIQWHVFAAFGTLKGGRADWLIEKCTELGASSVTPLLTERCHTIAENRVDRLQRLVLAAVKQYSVDTSMRVMH